MKKILMPILLIAHYLNPLLAQIQKGSWLIGGSGNLDQSSFVDKNGRSISSTKFGHLYLNPELGYFMTNRWVIGARASVYSSTISFRNINGQLEQQTSYENVSIEPFTRIYFNPQHRFKCFYDFFGGGFVAKHNRMMTFFDSISIQNSFYMGNMLGVNYFLTDNIAIEGFINYNFYSKFKSVSQITEISFPKFIFNPTFRMRLFLNTKTEKMESVQKYFEKGNLTYGIRMNMFFNKNSEFNTSSFAPSIGYFLMTNLMIGSELSMNYASSGTIGVHFMPEVRYYHPTSRLTQVFGRLLFRNSYSVNNQIGNASKFKRQELEIGAGINRFLAPNISIQSSLNAAIISDNLNSDIELKPSFRIGFQYFMSKK